MLPLGLHVLKELRWWEESRIEARRGQGKRAESCSWNRGGGFHMMEGPRSREATLEKRVLPVGWGCLAIAGNT